MAAASSFILSSIASLAIAATQSLAVVTGSITVSSLPIAALTLSAASWGSIDSASGISSFSPVTLLARRPSAKALIALSEKLMPYRAISSMAQSNASPDFIMQHSSAVSALLRLLSRSLFCCLVFRLFPMLFPAGLPLMPH